MADAANTKAAMDGGAAEAGLLARIADESPGRYLTMEEKDAVLRGSPYMAPRLAAASDAEARHDEVVERTVKAVLKKFDFKRAYEYGEDKCIRDVGAVYRWAVFCMLCGDRRMFEDKLLLWMRTVIQSFGFPGGNESIRMSYARLRTEAGKALRRETMELLEPYLAAAEEILPADTLD